MSIVWLMVIYIFAVMGVTLFDKSDPGNFASLDVAILNLFVMSTPDGWHMTLSVPHDPVCPT